MEYPEQDGLMMDDDDDLEEDRPLVGSSTVDRRKQLTSCSHRRLCILCTILSISSFSLFLLSRKPKPLPIHDEEEVDLVYHSNSTDASISLVTESNDNENGTAYRYPATLPEVAWIMSFGGSGTSYTILNTEALTGQSTASNYAKDYETLVPVHADYTNGPYIRSLGKPLPADYILTKTHCGGYCMDCPPAAYYFTSGKDFLTACLSGHAHDEFFEMTTTTYSSTIPQRAVHLVRSPFDNVVGRFHLSTRRFKKRGQDVSAFPNNVTGLENWCTYLDDKYRAKTAAMVPELVPFLHVPCYAEWFRYIQWHNMATAAADQLDIPVHYLWYDNYTHDFQGTVDQLFEFLHLESVAEPYEWHPGHSYRNFFPTPKAAIAMMRELATDRTWRLIEAYIDEYNAQEETIDDDTDDDGSEEDDDGLEDDEETANAPHVAWLLSFPNSGTSYTITNVEWMTGASTATNYARDIPDAIPITPDGPYLHTSDKPIPDTILTKTHCFGYCNLDCGPDVYRPSQDSDFLEGCLTVQRPGGGVSQYNESVPDRAVHLFRNPMDNIVSRMHLSLKNKAKQGWTLDQLQLYETSEEGLKNWCKIQDAAYTREEAESFSSDLLELFDGVPCHADFYRYTIWHNQAIEMVKRLGIPVHYLYYEDYSTDYDGTVLVLLEFLELDVVKKPRAFETGKVYTDLYDDVASIARLVEAVATPETWRLVRHYFE